MQRVEFGMPLMVLKEPGLTLKKKEVDGTMKTKLRLVLGTLMKVQISLEFGKMIMYFDTIFNHFRKISS